MFYDVRILDPDGKIKKILHSRELSKKHWENFRKMEDSISLTANGAIKVPGWVKRRLELEHPEFFAGVSRDY